MNKLKNRKIYRQFAVITGLVPVILVQRRTNQVNKLALLFKRSILRQDCRNASGNDGCRGRGFSTFSQSGRSIIEMLGVLAIIAMLSVGGIAGYSKAMQMYKLNKWKSDFIYMMTNIKTVYLNSKTYSDKNEDILPLLKELEIIPQNMLTPDNKDVFGNKLFVGVRPMAVDWGVPLRFAIRLDTLPNKDSIEQCKVLFDFLNYFDDAWIVALNENTESNKHYVCGKASTKYYYQHIGCKPYNWSEILQKCSVCATQICDIKFILNNNN